MQGERHEMQQGQPMPGPMMIAGVGLLVVVLLVLLVMRSRQKSRADRALDRISHVIDDSDLPDRAKDILLETVEEVRGALATIRSRASEMRG